MRAVTHPAQCGESRYEPPKLKWQKTSTACEALFVALETIAGVLWRTNVPGEVVGALADARKKVADLKELDDLKNHSRPDELAKG